MRNFSCNPTAALLLAMYLNFFQSVFTIFFFMLLCAFGFSRHFFRLVITIIRTFLIWNDLLLLKIKRSLWTNKKNPQWEYLDKESKAIWSIINNPARCYHLLTYITIVDASRWIKNTAKLHANVEKSTKTGEKNCEHDKKFKSRYTLHLIQHMNGYFPLSTFLFFFCWVLFSFYRWLLHSFVISFFLRSRKNCVDAKVN